jgi:hypothetical protein
MRLSGVTVGAVGWRAIDLVWAAVVGCHRAGALKRMEANEMWRHTLPCGACAERRVSSRHYSRGRCVVQSREAWWSGELPRSWDCPSINIGLPGWKHTHPPLDERCICYHVVLYRCRVVRMFMDRAQLVLLEYTQDEILEPFLSTCMKQSCTVVPFAIAFEAGCQLLATHCMFVLI